MWNEKLNRKLKAVTTLVDSYAFWLVGIYLSYVVARLQFISFLLLLSMNSASITSANPCVHYEEMSLEQPLSAGLTSMAAFSLVLLHFKLKVVLHATEKCLDIFPRILVCILFLKVPWTLRHRGRPKKKWINYLKSNFIINLAEFFSYNIYKNWLVFWI